MKTSGKQAAEIYAARKEATMHIYNDLDNEVSASEVIAGLQERIADLEAERDDYKDRCEQTGCSRHGAMEAAIKVKDSALERIAELEQKYDTAATAYADLLTNSAQEIRTLEARLDAAERFARSIWTGEGGLNYAFDRAWKEALGNDDA